jgi:serine/threonine-protein kinase
MTMGRRLLHYELVERLGVGGMGEVWRARDARLDREVAIKILPPGDATSVLQERFLREARAASALIHPNIITVHEINAADGTDFIVMEYVRGETLAAVVARGPLPVSRALQYALQICDALQTAHEAGVVHRDLKPANIMIAASGRVKVLDFGIAKRLGGMDADMDVTSAATLTAKGVSLGTPAYMSPEQTLGDPVDARSDLFSFGVVLYQMLAGVLPFQAGTTLSLVRQIVHDSPPPLRTVAPAVPGALEAIVEKCLEKNPDDRYPAASAVGDALKRVTVPIESEDSSGETRTHMAVLPPAGRPARRVARRLAVAAGLVLVAVAAAWAGGPPLARWMREMTTRVSQAPDPDAGATPQILYERATERLRFSYREGNVQKAIGQLERALQLKPVYPIAEARLSLAYSRKNELSADQQWQRLARAHADRAVTEDPQLAIAHVAQGRALAQAGELDKALAAYQRAHTLDPANWDLLWRMGDLAVKRKEPAATIEDYYKRSVQAGPKEWEASMRLGTFYYRQGRYDEALKAYQTAVDLAPDNPRSPSNIAAVYHHLGRTDEAAAWLQRSLAIAPDSLTYSNLGTLLYFQGKYPEAVGAFDHAIQLGANTYLYWGNLADAARMAGDATKAHESYTRAVQLAQEQLSKSPDDADLRSSVALYFIRDGQAAKGLPELDKVLAQKTLPPNVLFKATIVAELAGQRARALELLERTLAAGYQFREISQEPDLVTLRTDPRYHKLAARFQK